MNTYLTRIHDLISQGTHLGPEEKDLLVKALAEADKQWAIVDFKLDRTEKVKKTTAILLEETIEELEQKRRAVEESRNALQQSLERLKAAQAQLVQSEKMASLGELTAGIAHEIQNPLNFVNNFAEVSQELADELKDEIDRGNRLDAIAIANDIQQNLGKILHHGKRADGIVKGMLQHSRTSSGLKEPTDLNVLADEYLRLAYHGLRAKDKTFNATFTVDLDPTLPKVEVVPQDIGRVLLNLINNAFYAVSEKQRQGDKEYVPTVTVQTRLSGANLEIRVIDNGSGIPESVKEKIFQPFFTTKPTGQGTGLGLSISYDIITKGHQGMLSVVSEPGESTTFMIFLPVNTHPK